MPGDRPPAGSLSLDDQSGAGPQRGTAPLPAQPADAAADRRAQRPKRCKLAQNERLRAEGSSVTEIADVLDVARATVYRHLAELTGADATAG